MKVKNKIFSLLMLCVIFLVSCTSSDSSDKYIEKIKGKFFVGYRELELYVAEFDGRNKLVFVPRNTDPLNESPLTRKEVYENPRVVEENGKRYLTADGFNRKIWIQEDNILICEDDQNHRLFTVFENYEK